MIKKELRRAEKGVVGYTDSALYPHSQAGILESSLEWHTQQTFSSLLLTASTFANLTAASLPIRLKPRLSYAKPRTTSESPDINHSHPSSVTSCHAPHTCHTHRGELGAARQTETSERLTTSDFASSAAPS